MTATAESDRPGGVPADHLDALLARAETLRDSPLTEHADVFESIHDELQRRLREADA